MFRALQKLFDYILENNQQLQKPKEVCNHEKTTPYYEYVRCNECAVITLESYRNCFPEFEHKMISINLKEGL